MTDWDAAQIIKLNELDPKHAATIRRAKTQLKAEIEARKQDLQAERTALAEEMELVRLGGELGKREQRQRHRALDKKLLAMDDDEPEEVVPDPDPVQEHPRTRPRRPDETR